VGGGENLRDGAAHVAAGQRVPGVAELGQRLGDDRGDPAGRHAGGGERDREREAGQRRHDHVQIGEQRQDALEAQHRIGPAVQQHDDRGAGISGSLMDHPQLGVPRRHGLPGQAVDPALMPVPVIPAGPAAEQLVEKGAGDAPGRVVAPRGRDPPGPREPFSQFSHHVYEHTQHVYARTHDRS
jgi:hypothetical protein